MIDCQRFGRWFGGCKFEARYDEKLQRPKWPSDAFWDTHNFTFKGPLSAVEKMRPTDTKTYVRDVCTRCGRTIERAKFE